jgi:hypothetical protein
MDLDSFPSSMQQAHVSVTYRPHREVTVAVVCCCNFETFLHIFRFIGFFLSKNILSRICAQSAPAHATMWQAILERFRALNGFMAQLWEMTTKTTTTTTTTTKRYDKSREQTSYERRQQEQERTNRVNRMASLTARPCLLAGVVVSGIFFFVSCFSFPRWLIKSV